MIKLPKVFSVQKSRLQSPMQVSNFYLQNDNEPLHLVGESHSKPFMVNTFSQNIKNQILDSLQPYRIPYRQPQTQFIFKNGHDQMKLKQKLDKLQQQLQMPDP